MYINKVMVFGNLTRDPELKTTPTGTSVTTLGVATNRIWTDRETKTRKEETEFHNITAFGVTADNIARYLKKGSSVYVEGRLRTNSWETNGVKKYRTEIIAEHVQFGPKRDSATTSGGAPTPQKKATDSIEYPKDDINPDDIPF